MEQAAAPACVLDDQGRVLVANRAPELLLGVGASGGLRGRTLASLAYPPDEELAQAAVQQVLVEGLDRCQVDARWVRIYSRELVWAAFDLSLVRDRRGRPELAIAMAVPVTGAEGWWRCWSCSSPTSGPVSRAGWSASPGSPRSSAPWSSGCSAGRPARSSASR